jgi:glycosyltransferase 2 family protein
MKAWPWLRYLQVMLTFSLLGLLLAKVDWKEVVTLVSNLHWRFVWASVAFVLLSHLVNVLRWQYLIGETAPGFGRLLVFYGAGLFSNNFLPTGVGGDAIRVALLRREVSTAQSVVSVILDRLLGFIALAALIIPGFFLIQPPKLLSAVSNDMNLLYQSSLLVIIVAIGLTGVVMLVILSRIYNYSCNKIIRIIQVLGTNKSASSNWLLFLSVGYGFSVLAQSFLVFAHWAVLRAVGVEVSFGVAVWLVLIVSISILLPISINGIGVQENLYVILLGQYGVNAIAGVGVALMIRLLMILFSLAGGLLTMAWRLPLADAHPSIDF